MLGTLLKGFMVLFPGSVFHSSLQAVIRGDCVIIAPVTLLKYHLQICIFRWRTLSRLPQFAYRVTYGSDGNQRAKDSLEVQQEPSEIASICLLVQHPERIFAEPQAPKYRGA